MAAQRASPLLKGDLDFLSTGFSVVIETVLTEAINIQQTKATSKIPHHPHCNDDEHVETYVSRWMHKHDEYDIVAFTMMLLVYVHVCR